MKLYVFYLSLCLAIFSIILKNEPQYIYAESTITPKGTTDLYLHIPKDQISKTGTLRITILNEEQIHIAEHNPECAVDHDTKTGETVTSCPRGTMYTEYYPETQEVAAVYTNSAIKVSSSHITVGKKFKIIINTLSNDDCNSIRYSWTGKATKGPLHILFSNGETTMIDCLR